MRLLAPIAFLVLALASPAAAQQRFLTVEITPTARTQLAIWIESADGTHFQTIRLTDAVAFRGIGNRPGALQMNSSYHWPYGRREGALPIWAHRRFDVTGVAFPRVIFAGRTSEGDASRAGTSEAVNTRDDYFCLSFTGGESLDAMSCASIFMSNKGRFVTPQDVTVGYGEPFEDTDGTGRMRPLSLDSLYPPRGDTPCAAGCPDHPDVAGYIDARRRVMPELDAITMATPARDCPTSITFDVPDDWPDGDYFVFVEANTEFDYAPGWDRETYPTPTQPPRSWDGWAIGTGMPYRGQPSVLYRVPVVLDPGGGTFGATTPVGYGDLHGLDGEMHPMDETIADDAGAAPGSGADRLRATWNADACMISTPPTGERVRVTVPETNPCNGATPPADCGRPCTTPTSCAAPLLCSDASVCDGRCELTASPAAPLAVSVEPVEDRRHSHEWARLAFDVPGSLRTIRSYEVRVSTAPIADEITFREARPAKAASLEDEALVVPFGQAEGSHVEVDLGGLQPQTHYWIAVRAYDDCHAPGPFAVAEIETPAIRFTTVSPCFVATAAYGSPLDARIGVLRRFRDRQLLTNAPGRALVSAYYVLGPHAAAWIAEDEDRRAAARAVLDPVVRLLE